MVALNSGKKGSFTLFTHSSDYIKYVCVCVCVCCCWCMFVVNSSELSNLAKTYKYSFTLPKLELNELLTL